MNLIIFAGGAGTRLWPISRTQSPKQFAPLLGNKSTLELAVERISQFGLDHIFISTNAQYVSVVEKQIESLDRTHILPEPTRRDVAPAVGLALLRLKKQGVSGAVSILWADHFVERPEVFRTALQKADAYVTKHPNQFVFLGEHPRFANHNLGWMKKGDELADGFSSFEGWKYRPEIDACKEMFESGMWLWNPGYFVFDIDTCLSLYETYQPAMFETLNRIAQDESLLEDLYPTVEAISFDNAIVEKISPSQAVVLPVDMGWSDPGTLYALKEAFAPSVQDNYTQGTVVDLGSKDSFIFNEEEGKLVTAIGLEGMCVVNTKDALLVCKKEDVPRIKELLTKVKAEGKEQYL